jgi:glycosidase
MTPKPFGPRFGSLTFGWLSVLSLACGSDATTQIDYGQPPNASQFNLGNGGGASPSPSGSAARPYGSAGGSTGRPPGSSGQTSGSGSSPGTSPTRSSGGSGGKPIEAGPGVFDWRDAVIYFVFVDRFVDGNPANNCNIAGSQATAYTSTNYLGGDWVGVTQKINAGYFTDLGVNTLWLTVPIKNADDVAGIGTNGDVHMYSAYHGYWPKDPTTTETCFGTGAELQALVQAAHAKQIKVLFDYAMVHVHTESPIYQMHKSDTPSWFTPTCVCASAGCGNFDTTCWFTNYLAHYDYKNPAARTFSINAAVQLIQQYGNDAFRLDAIKQVDVSWLASLRPAIQSQILAKETPSQRFYMVGETYDFQDRAQIRALIDPAAQLDGQFDFPLRIRLIETLLMRSTQNLLTPDDLSWSRTAPPGMKGLAQFMDSNDAFYPASAVMSTFIGNHDLPRSIHYAEQTLPAWIQNDSPMNPSAGNAKSAAWTKPPQLVSDPNAYERMANAFAVILTNKGAPLIYYGDEIGLPGAGDPDNRRMMQWGGYSAAQQGLFDRIKALNAIRAAHAALRRGTRATLFADTDLWVYALTTGAGDSPIETVYVAINRSDTDRQATQIPAGLTELISNTPANGTIIVPARQTRIFH